MVRRNLRVAFCTLMVSILLGINAMAAFAAVSSPWKNYGPYLGYSYQNRAAVGSNDGVWARTSVQNQVSSDVPTSYMGAAAKLYNSAGQLREYTDMIYNDSPTRSMSVITANEESSGTYYSKGMTSAYHGNGYNVFSTYQSPNINY